MSEVKVLLLVAVVVLVAAWLINAMVALLSGEHPRDTWRVWLDLLFGGVTRIDEELSWIRPRWFRWTIMAAFGVTALWFILRG